MIDALIQMAVYLTVNLLMTKLIFFRKDPKAPDTTMSWKGAVDSIGIMETRLQQVQDRDVKQQERVWALEDMNRDLVARMARMSKDLATRPIVSEDDGSVK